LLLEGVASGFVLLLLEWVAGGCVLLLERVARSSVGVAAALVGATLLVRDSLLDRLTRLVSATLLVRITALVGATLLVGNALLSRRGSASKLRSLSRRRRKLRLGFVAVGRALGLLHLRSLRAAGVGWGLSRWSLLVGRLTLLLVLRRASSDEVRRSEVGEGWLRGSSLAIRVEGAGVLHLLLADIRVAVSSLLLLLLVGVLRGGGNFPRADVTEAEILLVEGGLHFEGGPFVPAEHRIDRY
jgi:hypothetical protein